MPRTLGSLERALSSRRDLPSVVRERGNEQAMGVAAGVVRVVLADGHALFRSRLRRLLVREGIDVVGETASGEEAILLACELVPDVLLTEIELEDMDGVESIARVSEIAPEVRILVLTTSAEARDVAKALLAGASGHVAKGSPPDRLAAAVHAVAVGGSLIEAPVAAQLLRGDAVAVAAGHHPGGVSARELEILRLLAAGKADPEIAAVLGLPPRALRNSVTRVLKKLQLRRRVATLRVS